jgi:hypothetical protein
VTSSLAKLVGVAVVVDIDGDGDVEVAATFDAYSLWSSSR